LSTDRTTYLSQHNFWNELIAMRDQQREQLGAAAQVVRRRDLPMESNSQGQMRWYMHPAIKDIALSTLSIYEQEIPPRSRSGRLQFQGGQIIFVIDGEGYTVIDGVKHAWKSRDVLNLPLKKEGIIVQHFNSSEDKPARILVVEPNLYAATTVDRGCGFEQLEAAPTARP
jgi:hypothetical protein